MPIHQNKKEHYFQWGNQKKYFYRPTSTKSIQTAYNKCKKQALAIILSRIRNQ